MGAEAKMWVEVEIRSTEWRESYGVTKEDAIYNVALDLGERPTGRVAYSNYQSEKSPDNPISGDI